MLKVKVVWIEAMGQAASIVKCDEYKESVADGK